MKRYFPLAVLLLCAASLHATILVNAGPISNPTQTIDFSGFPAAPGFFFNGYIGYEGVQFSDWGYDTGNCAAMGSADCLSNFSSGGVGVVPSSHLYFADQQFHYHPASAASFFTFSDAGRMTITVELNGVAVDSAIIQLFSTPGAPVYTNFQILDPAFDQIDIGLERLDNFGQPLGAGAINFDNLAYRDATAVPEPSSLLLLGTGLLAGLARLRTS